jgi:VWFA-related protein
VKPARRGRPNRETPRPTLVRRTLLEALGIALLSVATCGSAAAQPATPVGMSPGPITWLIFVDDLHLDFRNTGRIRDDLRMLAKELIQDGDHFTIASSGPSNLAAAMTSDAQALNAAIKTVVGNALRLEDIYQSPNASAEVFYRASVALTAAHSTLTNLPGTASGRTAMVYVSNGYSFDLLPDPAPGAARLGPGRDVTRAEVHAQLRELIATATRMAVPIFTIERRTADLDSPPLPAEPLRTAHSVEMRRTLRSIAETTGGFAVAVDYDFAAQLKRVSTAVRR